MGWVDLYLMTWLEMRALLSLSPTGRLKWDTESPRDFHPEPTRKRLYESGYSCSYRRQAQVSNETRGMQTPFEPVGDRLKVGSPTRD